MSLPDFPQLRDAGPTPHDLYVRDGYCPAVLWTKAWCNATAGHTGPHCSTLILPGGRTRLEPWPDNARLRDDL